jgi:hypothetical protein
LKACGVSFEFEWKSKPFEEPLKEFPVAAGDLSDDTAGFVFLI